MRLWTRAACAETEACGEIHWSPLAFLTLFSSTFWSLDSIWLWKRFSSHLGKGHGTQSAVCCWVQGQQGWRKPDGEMAQWLRAHTSPAEDSGLVLSTYIRWLTKPVSQHTAIVSMAGSSLLQDLLRSGDLPLELESYFLARGTETGRQSELNRGLNSTQSFLP